MTTIQREAQRNELGQHIPAHYHYQMLADSIRMKAFAAAIRHRVQSTMRVADLGSGTGVLAFFAAQCGAKVWAVEAIPELANMMRQFVRANKVEDRVHVVNADAALWLPPEPVDIVLCEMLHSALLREKQVEVIQSFREAHVKQFGSAPLFLPEATLLAVQPVTQDYCWSDGYYAPVPLFQSAYVDAADCVPRGVAVTYATLDYSECVRAALVVSARCVMTQAATINALRFVTRSVLAMDLSTGATVDWYNQNLILPLCEPLALDAGQCIDINFAYRPGDSIGTLSDSLIAAAARASVATAP